MYETLPKFLDIGVSALRSGRVGEETEEITTREGPEGLERKYAGTHSAPVYGGIGESHQLPFKALKSLIDEGIYTRAAAMRDPNIMLEDEGRILNGMLNEIDPSADYSATLEEEQIDEYDTTIKRLKAFTEPEFAEELERQIMDEATEKIW